jgi:hypothetical protein
MGEFFEKLQALQYLLSRSLGVLNPHPEQVTDELFQTASFSILATSFKSSTKCCAGSKPRDFR